MILVNPSLTPILVTTTDGKRILMKPQTMRPVPSNTVVRTAVYVEKESRKPIRKVPVVNAE